ncbi:ABC transporter permease [Acinetobacter sp. WZC-1]|uniref:ABC transporter permease n=1 Tax=Acinetobacter sp. WZC-1 TaxID=3459034 RepID=UPI00403E22EC
MSQFASMGAVARDEWRFILRSKVALISIFLLISLTLISVFTSYEYQRSVNQQRLHYQSQANHEFEAQPDRHPHRVAHFGHFLFRPLDPLAAFDAGVDTYTGHTLYLEAHRQNSANFSDVRQSSLLVRFGQLTPAFILQVLVPLLLIFVGHATISRERQSGTLRLLFSQGISARTFIAGKLIALSGVAILSFLPAAIALIWIGISQQLSVGLVSMLTGAYLLWLLLWVVGVVLVSALVANGRDALLGLLAIWTFSIIVLPRIAPDIISKYLPLSTHIETHIAVEHDINQIGDSHNPDDPYFENFKKKVLAQYGVSRVEDLPVNYKGLLMAEGERLTSELFNQYVRQSTEQQQRQNSSMDWFAGISPVLSLRRLSMIATASDLKSFNLFMQEAENYRYNLIQHLNQLQTREISYNNDTDDNKENRLNHQHWQEFPPFHFQAMSSAARIQAMIPSMMVLCGWFLLLVFLIIPVSKRMERKVK